MLPSTWLREPSFTRIRKRPQFKFWTREDFTNFAKAQFGTDDISLTQLQELVSELKKPDAKPPGGLVAKAPIVIMAPNPPHYTGEDQSRLYLSKGLVKIQHKDIHEALDWAYRLMVRTGLPWEKAKARQAEGMKIPYFHEIWSQKLNIPGLIGLKLGQFKLDEQLEKTLQRLTKEWRRNTTPYPDNTPLLRQYNSLSVGDELKDADGSTWVVSKTRSKLEGPPEVELIPKAGA